MSGTQLSHGLDDLQATVAALFPGSTVRVGRLADVSGSFRLVPSARSPRLLVAADSPKAAAGAVDRPSANDTARRLAVRRVVGQIVGMPRLAKLLMPHGLTVTGEGDGSLRDHLCDVLGRDVRLSLAIGSRRANRKPVLAIHDVDGSELGYAKVGLTELANELIDHEASELREHGDRPPTSYVAPRLMHHGTWNTSSVLVMESLRPVGRTTGRAVPSSAVAELSARDGLRTEPAADAAWLDTLGDRAATTEQQELGALVELYRERFAGIEMPIGRWHGDFGPWNMAWDGPVPLIWDWERSAARVPAGIDVVHFTCHSTLRSPGDLAAARRVLSGPGAEAYRAVLAILDRGARPEPAQLRAGIVAYLLLIADRFSADAARPGGDAVGRLARWYLAVARDQLDNNDEVHRWN